MYELFWIIATCIVIFVLYATTKKLPTNDTVRLSNLFEYTSHSYFEELQTELENKMEIPYDKDHHFLFGDKKQYNSYRAEIMIEHREHEIGRYHVLTVLTSDKHTTVAKHSAVNAWNTYMGSKHRLYNAIETGYLDSHEMDSLRKEVSLAKQSFYAVMEAFNYNIEKEIDIARKEMTKMRRSNTP